MAKVKRVSNEAVIAALIEHGSVAKAAEVTGLSARTIYDRFQEKSFLSDYCEAKGDLIRSAVLLINKRLIEAIETASKIQADESVNAAVRLQAAGLIFKNAAQFNAVLNSIEGENRETRSPFNLML